MCVFPYQYIHMYMYILTSCQIEKTKYLVNNELCPMIQKNVVPYYSCPFLIAEDKSYQIVFPCKPKYLIDQQSKKQQHVQYYTYLNIFIYYSELENMNAPETNRPQYHLGGPTALCSAPPTVNWAPPTVNAAPPTVNVYSTRSRVYSRRNHVYSRRSPVYSRRSRAQGRGTPKMVLGTICLGGHSYFLRLSNDLSKNNRT